MARGVWRDERRPARNPRAPGLPGDRSTRRPIRRGRDDEVRQAAPLPDAPRRRLGQDERFYKDDPDHYHPDGGLKALGVTPKPYQKPYPPIWQSADNTMSHAFAAGRGHSVIGINRSFEGTREAWTKYREVASEQCGRRLPMGVCANGQTLNAMRTFHIAETQEEAEREARPGINAFYDAATGLNPNWARKGLLAAHESISDEDENLDWFDFLQKYEVLAVGSPDFVAERIHKFREELNCQHFTLWPNPGFVPFRKVLRGIGLFAERVIPQFERTEVQAAE